MHRANTGVKKLGEPPGFSETNGLAALDFYAIRGNPVKDTKIKKITQKS